MSAIDVVGPDLSATCIRGGRPPATFPMGRICGYLGCTTKLSIYNEKRFCSLHGPIAVRPMRERRN